LEQFAKVKRKYCRGSEKLPFLRKIKNFQKNLKNFATKCKIALFNKCESKNEKEKSEDFKL
jgi:hypothetical protein